MDEYKKGKTVSKWRCHTIQEGFRLLENRKKLERRTPLASECKRYKKGRLEKKKGERQRQREQKPMNVMKESKFIPKKKTEEKIATNSKFEEIKNTRSETRWNSKITQRNWLLRRSELFSEERTNDRKIQEEESWVLLYSRILPHNLQEEINVKIDVTYLFKNRKPRASHATLRCGVGGEYDKRSITLQSRQQAKWGGLDLYESSPTSTSGKDPVAEETARNGPALLFDSKNRAVKHSSQARFLISTEAADVSDKERRAHKTSEQKISKKATSSLGIWGDGIECAPFFTETLRWSTDDTTKETSRRSTKVEWSSQLSKRSTKSWQES